MTVLDITAKLNIHHSIELSLMNQMDPKTHTYSTVYMSVFSGLEPSTSYGFRLRVTRASGECSLSPVLSLSSPPVRYFISSQLGLLFSYFKPSNPMLLSAVIVDVDVYDKMGFSPLMVAAQKGFTSLVDILVKHGADINKKDSTGKDSLMQACFAGHLDTVKYLRNCGSTWQSQDTDGCTPLHWAVDGGHLPVITYMIQDGCEVDVMDKVSLWTPLMCVSAISGNAAVASILLQAGADVNFRDKVAVLNNHVELVKPLLYGGADHHMKNEVTDYDHYYIHNT
uniref:Fibronectin type III and ankyrin repeat domains 1 n=1 Tax=Sinocyclocheilus rhinocerous TaxID=307959 RepID=A0A673LL32_9TELE